MFVEINNIKPTINYKYFMAKKMIINKIKSILYLTQILFSLIQKFKNLVNYF